MVTPSAAKLKWAGASPPVCDEAAQARVRVAAEARGAIEVDEVALATPGEQNVV